jgi:hypothetical protein
LFDAFSSREPVSTPDQIRGRLSLENAMAPLRNGEVAGSAVFGETENEAAYFDAEKRLSNEFD